LSRAPKPAYCRIRLCLLETGALPKARADGGIVALRPATRWALCPGKALADRRPNAPKRNCAGRFLPGHGQAWLDLHAAGAAKQAAERRCANLGIGRAITR
jgi:hypothetical protein